MCVYDAIMYDAARTFEVEHKDLAMLRLSLLLSGPDHGKLGRLLEKESDPRERRQLSILRTERELFDRALARVPKTERRKKAQGPDLGALEKAVAQGVPVASATPLLATAAKLAEVSDAGGPGSMEAATLLDTTLTHLAERALRTGTTAGAGPQKGPREVVAELTTLADGLEKASGTTRPVARWLRGRAVRILLDSALLSGAQVGAALDAKPTATTLEVAGKQGESTLASLESLLATCATLRAAGAEEPAGVSLDQSVALAVSRVEDELVEIWDHGFRETVASALAKVGSEQLGVLLTALGPVLVDIDAFGARLVKLGARQDSLKSRVVAPRLEPLVRAAFERVDTGDRIELVTQVGVLVDQLQQSGLRGVIPKATILRFAAAALTRSEHKKAKSPKPASSAQPDFAAYRALRAGEQRVSLSYTTVELALRIAPDKPSATGSSADLVAGVASFIGALPDDLRHEIVELDLARVGRAVSFVEGWWRILAKDAEAATAAGAVANIGAALRALAESKFFHVTRDEGALLRFALESRVVGDVFPEALERAVAMRARIDAIEADSSRMLGALRRGRADVEWTMLLGPESGGSAPRRS